MGGDKAPLRFALCPGKDADTGQPRFEIEGSITGGTTGTVIFTLPFTLDYDIYRATVDSTGATGSVTIQQSGDVIAGYV